DLVVERVPGAGAEQFGDHVRLADEVVAVERVPGAGAEKLSDHVSGADGTSAENFIGQR
ncbi:hypothetical protein HKB23_06030, partial [Vibrio parahaemolyticus]|nr:hypothetical protein [Vibrio parahaemolyticus]